MIHDYQIVAIHLISPDIVTKFSAIFTHQFLKYLIILNKKGPIKIFQKEKGHNFHFIVYITDKPH